MVAFVVAKDAPVNADELKDFLASRLARYKIPREFVPVDQLPHTPTGKVRKYELRARLKGVE